MADADRLLALARQAWVELPEDSGQRQSIVAGAELLGQLLLQDVERKSGDADADADDGVSIRDGVSKDRMPSVHDPELRHGHKSSRRRFNGHKAAIVVDTDSQLITAVDVLPGNAPDNLGALELVEASEASTGSVVEEAMGDAAYGDGGTRQTFADAGRRLVAKVPGRPNRKHFPKNDFHLDLAAGSCTCPAGQVTHTIVPAGKRTDRAGRVYRLQAFQFDGAACRVCPLRSQCIAAKGRKGRRVLIHPQEALLQQARALQQSADYDEYRARRVVVEHRLARLVQLGIRQARYFGRVKTKFQLYLAATVANLTLVAGKIGLLGSTGGGAAGHRVVRNDVRAVVANAAANFSAVRLGQLWSLILLTSALLPQLHFQIRAFREGLTRIAVTYLDGEHWVEDGQWYRRDDDGAVTPIGDVLERCWQAAMAVRSRLKEARGIKAYVVSVAVFTGMAPDGSIVAAAASRGTRVLFGLDDHVERLAALPGEQDLQYPLQARYIPDDAEALSRPPASAAAEPETASLDVGDGRVVIYAGTVHLHLHLHITIVAAPNGDDGDELPTVQDR